MKKILIPIDFSDNAGRALAAAKILAKKESTELLIMHVYQLNVHDMTVPSGAGMLPVSPELEATFRGRLNDMVKELQVEGYKATSLWSSGGIHPAVFEAIEQHNPDMVVLGRTGTGGFLDKLIGSAATRIGLDAKCPVMIVPPQANIKAFKEVVYATQLEYDENDVLREAFPLFKELGSRLSFVKIDSPTQPDIQSDHQFVTQIKNEFGVTDNDFVIKKSDSVIEGIENYCDSVKADLLVMSARHRGFIEAFITNPSLTRKMIIDTHVPLLIFHIKE
jgi:nucleotide-binding universal stress UspA family protein